MADLKTALVTAGGSGMGADAARRLAADGFNVGVLSASGKGEALGKELGGLGHTGSNLDPAALQAFFIANAGRGLLPSSETSGVLSPNLKTEET